MIPTGCFFFNLVALHVSWYHYLESLIIITPQLYADNFKCISHDVDILLEADQYTVAYVEVVGREASAGKCVLKSTCAAAHKTNELPA